MRPLSLRLENFTSFRGLQEPLELRGLELFAIAGPTGAGKSSLLDAMMFALYGTVPRLARAKAAADLIALGRDRMMVAFDFALGGDELRVVRSVRRGRTVVGDAQLERLEAPEQEPGGVRRGDVAGGVPERGDPLRVLRPPADERAEEHVVVAGEELRGGVEDVVGAVPRRPVPVAVPAILARQQPVERVEQVVVRAGPDLQDDDARRGVRHEHRQEPVLRPDIVEESGAGRGQVGQTASTSRADGQDSGLYGKMLRRASRMRPRPPIAGADSKRSGSPPASDVAPHWSSPTAVL